MRECRSSELSPALIMTNWLSARVVLPRVARSPENPPGIPGTRPGWDMPFWLGIQSSHSWPRLSDAGAPMTVITTTPATRLPKGRGRTLLHCVAAQRSILSITRLR
jgi:hypothetical protein